MTAAQPAQEPFLNPRTAELLKKYVMGGAAIGGGIGLSTSLGNYLNYLRQKSVNADKDTSHDDDVLYVDVPHEKQANATLTGLPGVGSGIALAGGTVSMLGANALVKKLYAMYKKRELQKDLDEAQQVYWDKSTMPKQAFAQQAPGKPVSALELASGTPVSLTLLAALASGVVANKTLSHYFPSRDKKEGPLAAVKPKQVKVRYVNKQPEEGQEKQASAESDLDMDNLLRDFAMISVLDGIDKEASYFPDLVYAVADGRIEEIKENLVSSNAIAALELVKGASQATYPTSDQKWAAISLLNRTDELAPITEQLFAAEVAESLPFFTKLASTYDEDTSETLCKIAATTYAGLASALIQEFTKDKEEEGEAKENPNKGYSVLSQLTEAASSNNSPEEREEDMIDAAILGK